MNHIKFFKVFLFLLCAMSLPLLSLIDLRNRTIYEEGHNIWRLAQGSNNNSADDLKQFYDFIITQSDIGSGGELVLTEPGRYILETDMTYSYSYALAISSDTVELDMAHRRLNGQGLADGGILIAAGVSPAVSKSKLDNNLIYRPGGATLANMHYITIKNGKIDDVLGKGVHADSTERIMIDRVQVTNADQGFYFNSCEDIELNNASVRYITNEGFCLNNSVQLRAKNLLAVECRVGALINGGLDGGSGGTGADMRKCYICGIIDDALCVVNGNGVKVRDSYFLVNGSAANIIDSKDILLDGITSVSTSTHSIILNNVSSAAIQNSTLTANTLGTFAMNLINGTNNINVSQVSASPSQ